ncbi:MAG: nucleotidyltransferase family protein [Candidatus Omnitrophota bacterium]|nr:nucleotidyltransferase family protein [Candidatus Omnitrophota bacterium]
MKALILAAGYATRLYPLTKEYPKPLLEVRGRPIIDYIVEKLEPAKAVNEIIVVTNSKFISLFRKWAKAKKISKPISLVDDLTQTLEDRRGAIGDMEFAIAKKRIKDDLLVIGGDNLFSEDIRDLLRFAGTKAGSPVIGAYDIHSKSEARHYGVIRMDDESKVVDFQEKPKKPASTLVAMCLYCFPKDKLGLISEYVRDKATGNDTTGSYISWLKSRVAVYGFTFTGRWYDIGDHKFLNEAKKRF